MSWIKATERGAGWLYTEYDESAYGLISVVAEWWGTEPADWEAMEKEEEAGA